MKLGKILLGTVLFVSFGTFAQDDSERECLRMQKLAQVARMEHKDYKESAKYLLMAEEICDGLDQKNTDLLIASLRNSINAGADKAEKTAYSDTLEAAFSRAEERGLYDAKNDLIRATNIIQTSKPNRAKADELYARGIATSGEKTNEAYVSYYYYNLYALYAETPDADKPALKSKVISVYFDMSALISKAKMSAKTQETITGYFNAVVKSCDDILPDLKGYMTALPEDPEVKKLTVSNFISLLEKKECTDAPEYGELIDIYVDIDPSSMEAQMMKAKYLTSKGKHSDAIKTLRTAKDLTDDEAIQQDITYQIAYAQFKSGSYTSAYNTAMSVSGENRGKALAIAGNAVAKNANNCGSSTFERKCNYIYAVQLLQQAAANGEAVGGAIASYKKNFPTDGEKFDNGSPSSVSLTCYGVSVNP